MVIPDPHPPPIVELHCVSNFTFLRGASHPEELVDRAAELGYRALAITDECSVAGVVRAHVRVRELERAGLAAPRLIVGTELALDDGFRMVALARDERAWRSLCASITTARRAAPKGDYALDETLLESGALASCALLLVPPYLPWRREALEHRFAWARALGPHVHLALELHAGPYDTKQRHWLLDVSLRHDLPLVAANDVHQHARHRRALQDVLTCVRHGCTLDEAGRRLLPNGERRLRSAETLRALYPADALGNAARIAADCRFSLDSLHYRYPSEIVPAGLSPSEHLRRLTLDGARERWPGGTPAKVAALIERELALVAELGYEPWFLTVHDIVRFARSRDILCQGRGSAANSAICFCLGITAVDPDRSRLLFERFLSKARDEPPDIDVDFEHERREEVIQYIYGKYGRDRAALAATVIRYRSRSAVRDLGKACGFAPETVEAMAKSMAWWDGAEAVPERLAELGLSVDAPLVRRFLWLLPQLVGFPRHLSQHVGGFVISEDDLATLVPVENAAMPDRTIVQWDKDDLEALGLMKVDVLALGMLTAVRKCFDLVERVRGVRHTTASIPEGDEATYDMICAADTVGVFQIESRAQMSMLPRLRPRSYYDLVIEISLVRPGPIQGGMVSPYLARREGLEEVTYPDDKLVPILERTLGVPVFQEQVMEIVMVAAGFDGGQADQLRRGMAAWKRSGEMQRFRGPVIDGMLANGYERAFAESLFAQIEGFGEYGFPESHAASFALLVYVSCWLKRHEPAAFLCAMLNSQPLGFYSPSELVQDARRHGVVVLPVDVNRSVADHRLVARRRVVDGQAGHQPDVGRASGASRIDSADLPGGRTARSGALAPGEQPAVRLGFRLVAKLSEAGIEALLAARGNGPFTSAGDLVSRSGIDRGDREALAGAGALADLEGDRHRAQWAMLGVEELPGLLADASADEPPLQLELPTEGEDIAADYRSLGLTLGRHPLALLRSRLAERRVIDSGTWKGVPNGRPARLAGLVTMRQRPGSAKGIMFVTLEDEGGPINVVVRPAIVERYRREVLGARLLAVNGKTQRASGVAHLIADRLEDLSPLLGDLVAPASRDFH